MVLDSTGLLAFLSEHKQTAALVQVWELQQWFHCECYMWANARHNIYYVVCVCVLAWYVECTAPLAR